VAGAAVSMLRVARSVVRELNLPLVCLPPETLPRFPAPLNHPRAHRLRLVQAGVTGILNFAPTRLRLPKQVYLEDIDMTTALEKTAYFARLAVLTRRPDGR